MQIWNLHEGGWNGRKPNGKGICKNPKLANKSKHNIRKWRGNDESWKIVCSKK
jgi:hypothetical protein